MTKKEVIDLYVKCQAENDMKPPRYADVNMYWEDESPNDIHSATIALSHFDFYIDDDDSILFYAGSVEGLLDLMEKDNGSDFVVTEVLDFY